MIWNISLFSYRAIYIFLFLPVIYLAQYNHRKHQDTRRNDKPIFSSMLYFNVRITETKNVVKIKAQKPVCCVYFHCCHPLWFSLPFVSWWMIFLFSYASIYSIYVVLLFEEIKPNSNSSIHPSFFSILLDLWSTMSSDSKFRCV